MALPMQETFRGRWKTMPEEEEEWEEEEDWEEEEWEEEEW